MRPMSKAAKAAAYDALKHQHDVLWEVMHILAAQEKHDACEMVCSTSELHDRTLDLTGESHEWYLYRSTWAHGGIVVHIQRIMEQHPSVDAVMLDDWAIKVDDLPHGIGLSTEVKIIVERFKAIRWRLLGEKYDRRPMTITHAMRDAEEREP